VYLKEIVPNYACKKKCNSFKEEAGEYGRIYATNYISPGLTQL
jgi:hypothetical protein